MVLEDGHYIYTTLPGDTANAEAARFGVATSQLESDLQSPAQGYLPQNTVLTIPNTLQDPAYPQVALPDGDIVNSPSAADIDIQGFVEEAGGYLKDYTEIYQGETFSGAAVVERVAVESSINPRFLLSLIEHRSGWVYSQPAEITKYPIGFHIGGYAGLYRELVEYLDLIKKIGVEKQVKVINQFVPNEDVAKYYQVSDLVLLPYRSATQSGILNVSYGFYKPVIVTDVGGLAEFVDEDKTGFVVNPNSPDAIVEGVNKFLSLREKKDFTAHIQERNRKNSFKQLPEVFEKILEESIE